MPFDVQSIDATFDTFEQFQAIFGLKVNFNKTESFPLGPLSETKMLERGKVKWSQDGVKTLGIHITHDSKTLIAKTFNPTEHQNIKPIQDMVNEECNSIWKGSSY